MLLEGWKLASGSGAPAHRDDWGFGKRVGRSEARIQTLKGRGGGLGSFHIITIKRAKALISPSKEWNVPPGGLYLGLIQLVGDSSNRSRGWKWLKCQLPWARIGPGTWE